MQLKEHSKEYSSEQPVSSKHILRVAVLLIVIFSLLAGYYQSRAQVWKSNNIKILQKFNVQTTKELLEKKVEVR